jgi:uncharacterized membrane protein YcaP (DUF421 family)
MNIDFSTLLEVLPRGLLSLLTLFIITKILGKKQVSELSLFDYVIGISIGNFSAEITINTDVPLINGITAILFFGLIAIAISKLTMKSIWLRRFVIGVPTVIIQNGKFIKENMTKTNFDMNDFLEECRGNGYFDISEIEYAIVEANGKISFLPKSEYKPLTPKDMSIKVAKQGLCANLIIDGKLMKKNLKNMAKTKQWLDKELRIRGYKDYEKILLATLDENEKLVIFDKNPCIKVSNVLE